LAKALGLRTLILVPRNNLVKQTKENGFDKFAAEVALEIIDDKTIKRRAAGFKPQVSISTYQKVNAECASITKGKLQAENRLINPNEYDLVIFDEGHGMLGKKTVENLQPPPEKIGIAFSATQIY